MKKNLIYLFLSLVSLICAYQVRAQDFGADLRTTYTFSDQNQAQVKLDFKLTNTSPTTYIQSYQVSVPEAGISGLVLQPKEQKIDKVLTVENGNQIFGLNFLNEVVGQGKSREFSLEYNDSNLLKTMGSARIIKIPALNSAHPYRQYETTIKIPANFGQPTQIKPTPLTSKIDSNPLIYTFDQKDNQAIELQFGNQQILQFRFTTDLINDRNTPIFRQVILPADKADVRLIYASLSPSPNVWQRHAQLGWLGFYLLRIGEQLTVTADGFIVVNQIDRDFDFYQYFPEFQGNLQLVNVDSIPPDFTFSSPIDKVKITTNLAKFGFLPLPGTYDVSINNLTGASWSNLNLTVSTDDQDLLANPVSANFELVPWQKTVIIVNTRSQKWWQLYHRGQIKLVVRNQEGTIIDETDQSGLTLSYTGLACLGGFLALAITTWSVLVARRK